MTWLKVKKYFFRVPRNSFSKLMLFFFKPEPRRLTAVITLFCFLMSSSGIAQAVVVPPSVPDAANTNPLSLDNLQVPEVLGSVEMRSIVSADGPGVLIIQDAHAISDAQRSIQKLIEYFQTEYGVTSVGLEGASSVLDPQIFRSFPAPKILAKVFEGYRQRGELAGGPAAAIFSKQSARYYGIEDWNLYEKGIRRYREALALEKPVFERIQTLKIMLQEKKSGLYSPQLLSLDALLNSFYENQSDFPETLKKLAKIKPPPAESELAALLSAANTEGDSLSDNAKEQEIAREMELSTEVSRLADEIQRHLEMKVVSQETRATLKSLNQKVQAFRTSQIEPQAFALDLKKIASQHAISVRVSKALSQTVQGQQKLENIRGTQLFEDFERYAAEVKTTLFQTQAERELDELNQRLRLIEAFAKLELSSDQWPDIQRLRSNNQAWIQNEVYLGSEAVAKHEINLLEMMVPHFHFYESAMARDEAFLKNLRKLMKKEKTERVILVAGGFHANAMRRLLQKAGISSVIIMPSIKTFPSEKTYQNQMRGEVSWKEYFEVEHGKVNLYRAFVRAVRDKLLEADSQGAASAAIKMERKRETLKKWRDQMIRDLAAQGRIEQSSQYTRFMDEAVSNRPQPEERGSSPLMDRAIEFANGLRQLQEGGQLTRENIRGLLTRAATIPVFEVAPFQTHLSVAGDLIAENVSTARSEVRSTLQLEPGQEITLDLGVLHIKDRSFTIKLNGEAHNREWVFEGVPDYIQYKYSSVNTQNMPNTEYTPGDKVVFKGVEFQQNGKKITLKNTRKTSLKITLTGNVGTEKEAEEKVTSASFPAFKENNISVDITGKFFLTVRIKGNPKKSYWLIAGDETKLSVAYIEDPEAENVLVWQKQPLNKSINIDGLMVWSDGNEIIFSSEDDKAELEVVDSNDKPLSSSSVKSKPEGLSGDGYEYEINGPYKIYINGAGGAEAEMWEIKGDSNNLKIGHTEGLMVSYLGTSPYSLHKEHTVGSLIIWSDGKRLRFKPKDPTVQLNMEGAENLIPKSGPAVLGAIKAPESKADQPKTSKKSLFYPIALSGAQIEIAIVGDEIWFSFKDTSGNKAVLFNLKDLTTFDVGRHPGMNVVVDLGHVSREHARVKVSGTTGNYTLTVSDLGSSNGTVVNGKSVSPDDGDVAVPLWYEEAAGQEAAPKVFEKPAAKTPAGPMPWSALKSAANNLDPNTQVDLEYFPREQKVLPVTSTLKHALKTLPKVDARVPEALDQFDHFEDINYELLNMLMKENITLNDYNALMAKLEAMLDQYLKLYEEAASTHLGKFELITEARTLFDGLKRNLQKSLDELPPGKKPTKPFDVLPTEFVTQLRNMNDNLTLEIISIQPGKSYSQTLLNRVGFHELINILHQKGVRNLLNLMESMGVEKRELQVVQSAPSLAMHTTGKIRYIDARKDITAEAPLPMRHVAMAFAKGQMVHNHYQRFNPENATVFADDEKAGVRMKLGVHSARVQYAFAPLQEKGRIVVNYQDSYENHTGSNNRLGIVEGVLKGLGFKVVRHGIRLDAYYDKDSASDFKMSEMPHQLTLVIQLLSMIKDWDLQLNGFGMGTGGVEKYIERILADGWVGQDLSNRLVPKLSPQVQEAVRTMAATIGTPFEVNAPVGQRDLDRIASDVDRLIARGAYALDKAGNLEKTPGYHDEASQTAPGEVLLKLLANADAGKIDRMRQMAAVARAAQSFAEPKVIGEIRGFQIVRLRFDLLGDRVTLYALREADSGVFRLGYAVLGDFFYDQPRIDLFRGKTLPNNLLSIQDLEEIFTPHHLDRSRELVQWQTELGRSEISPKKTLFELLKDDSQFLEQAVLPFNSDELKWGASGGIISTTSVGGTTVTQGKVIARVRVNRLGVRASAFNRQVFLAESADFSDNEKMKQAAAIVVTTGSPQSHAAIQAREWKTPAVIARGAVMGEAGLSFQAPKGKPKRKVISFEDENMSIMQLAPGSDAWDSSFGGQTADISDGDIVYVDATSGMLYLLAKAGDRESDRILRAYDAWKDSEKGKETKDKKLEVLRETVLNKIQNMSLFRAVLDELLYAGLVTPDELEGLLKPLLQDAEKKEVVQTFFERRLRMTYGDFLKKFKALMSLPIDGKDDIRSVYLMIDGLEKLRVIANSLAKVVQGNVSLIQENMERMGTQAHTKSQAHQKAFQEKMLAYAEERMQNIRLSEWQAKIQQETPSDELASQLSNDLGSIKRIASNLRLAGLPPQQLGDAKVTQFFELEAGLQDLRDAQVNEVLGDRYVVTKEELLDQHTYKIAGRKSSNSAQLARGLELLGELFSLKVFNPRGFAVSTKAYQEWQNQSDRGTLDPKVQAELRQHYHRLVDRQRKEILTFLETDTQTLPRMKSYLNSVLDVNSEDVNDALIRIWHKTFLKFLSSQPGEFSTELRDRLQVFASVAVRSSGVEEDSPDAAHAGQKETKLNVVGSDNLFKAVIDVWTSGAEGILIDEMTNPQKGILAFSMDATSSEPNIRISSAYGLTQGLVDAANGVPNPDEYVVGRNGGTSYPILKQVIGNKTKAVILDLEKGGTRHADIGELFPGDPLKAKQPVLEKAQVQLVARVVDMLSKYLGYPVDLEGAFRGNDLLIYQVRPITTIREAVERGQALVSAVRSEVRVKKPTESELHEALEFIYDKIPSEVPDFFDARIRFAAIRPSEDDGIAFSEEMGGISQMSLDHETMDFLDDLQNRLRSYYDERRGIRTALEKSFWTLSRLFMTRLAAEEDAPAGGNVFYRPGVLEDLEFNTDDYARAREIAVEMNKPWAESVLLALMKTDTLGRQFVENALAQHDSFARLMQALEWPERYVKESFPYTLRLLNEYYPDYWSQVREQFGNSPFELISGLPRLSSEALEYRVAEKTLERILGIGLQESDVFEMVQRGGIYMHNIYSRDFEEDNDRLIQSALKRAFVQVLRASPATQWTWAGSDDVGYGHTEGHIDKELSRIFYLFRQLAAFHSAGASNMTADEMISTLAALNRIVSPSQSLGRASFEDQPLVTEQDLRPGLLLNPLNRAGEPAQVITLILSVEDDGTSFYVLKFPRSSLDLPSTEWKNHLQNAKVTVEKMEKANFRDLAHFGSQVSILKDPRENQALSDELQKFSRSEVRQTSRSAIAAPISAVANKLAFGFLNVEDGHLSSEDFADQVSSAVQEISLVRFDDLLEQFIESVRSEYTQQLQARADEQGLEFSETYHAVITAMKAIAENVRIRYPELGARVAVAMSKSNVADIKLYGDAVKELGGMIESVSVQGLTGQDLDSMLQVLREAGVDHRQAVKNIESVADAGQAFVPALFAGASRSVSSRASVLPLGIAPSQVPVADGSVSADIQMIQRRFAIFLLFASAPAALSSLSAEDVEAYNDFSIRGPEQLSERELEKLNRIKAQLLGEIGRLLSLREGQNRIDLQNLFTNGLDLNMTVVNEIIQSYRTAAAVAKAA